MKQTPSLIQLEAFLLHRGLTVVKSEGDWQIRRGVLPAITYYPATGSVRLSNSAIKFNREALRGSPETIAEVLDGLATGKSVQL